jgi:thiol-disulfide isomerase/thioredoxin
MTGTQVAQDDQNSPPAAAGRRSGLVPAYPVTAAPGMNQKGMSAGALPFDLPNRQGAPMNPRRILPAVLVCLLPLALPAQTPSSPSTPPAAAPTPAPNIDLRMIRMKISAGDLPSAESILEYHRQEVGEDGDYVQGLAWLARGAALTGDWTAASAWASRARETAEAKLKSPADYDSQRDAVYALGTSIEVQAQALQAAGKKAEALRFLEESAKAQDAAKAPYNLRARIWKRRNLIELEGRPAPEIRAEDRLGETAPTLASLRGKPVVLFFWWEACGDCRMQAATLRKTVAKYAPKGVVFVAPTRFYSTGDHAEEKGKIEKSWSETYNLTGTVPVPISDEAMLRYGVSATPTFVFVDRKGIVKRYSPTRMSEERLAATIDDLMR